MRERNATPPTAASEAITAVLRALEMALLCAGLLLLLGGGYMAEGGVPSAVAGPWTNRGPPRVDSLAALFALALALRFNLAFRYFLLP